MTAGSANRPVGTRYNRAIGAWLATNGLAEIAAQEPQGKTG
ncbi:hypothetical protein [Bradyrhizobium sp. Ash2021]|nr:hypothetical protein [Bradyrhizobium sp. Ash2021]